MENTNEAKISAIRNSIGSLLLVDKTTGLAERIRFELLVKLTDLTCAVEGPNYYELSADIKNELKFLRKNELYFNKLSDRIYSIIRELDKIHKTSKYGK